MPEDCRNIYKICRKAAGFTQEAAAERLGISHQTFLRRVKEFCAC